MSKLGQEPAFGFEYSTFEGTPLMQTRTFHHPMGMSKRFYAACAAMQGMLANSTYCSHLALDEKNGEKSMAVAIAKDAFELADELLRQE